MLVLFFFCMFFMEGAPAGVGAAPAPDVRRDGSCWPNPPGTDPERCPPNDPNHAGRWEFGSRIPDPVDRSRMHPSEIEIGSIGMSVDAAWQHTIGRDDVVIAVLDSGILWDHRDLLRKIHLNAGELPPPEGSAAHDKNGDGVFDIDDYAGDSRVGDRNGNGLLDPGDLIRAFSNCVDEDGNGYPDDIAGYDFVSGSHCGFEAGDNDPSDDTRFGHGTGIASTAAAETNNGIGDAGVCPRCRVLPVRVGDSFVVDANRFARGLVYAVRAGASVVASALGAYNNTPAARLAVDLAWESGVPVIASAADEFSYHHNYPSVYGHALYVNAIRYNHPDDPRKATTFWGVNPCTNFGARVWVTVPATSCSSGATSRLAGIAGLVESAAREGGAGDLHAEEVYQILRMTAIDLDNVSPDWSGILYPARPGFDQLYGYGRVNALEAVLAASKGRIPPIVDLATPDWFEIVSPVKTPRLPVAGSIRLPRAESASYRLEYALGVEPAEEDYRLVAEATVAGSKEGVLGALDFTRLPLPQGPPPRNRDERDRYSVTLRLRVTDDRGLVAEARRSFFVLDDPSWKKHFPVTLGASGEAAPLLVDLDGDGRDAIVLPTADGWLRIVRWEEAGLRVLRVPLDRGPSIDPTGGLAARKGSAHAPRETVVRGAAAGDLHGRGERSLVVASRDGTVYAFNARGERLGGFPVSVDPARARPATPERAIERGILSTPVLADLDGKPGLEIVVGALDGHIYAWRGDGKPVPGFPVAIEEEDKPGSRSKIVSMPAVGDIDGDGRPEIVFGSNRIRDGLAGAWAIRAAGTLDPRGAFVPGWRPFEVPGLRTGLLPTVASGIEMGPLLVDVDGDGDQEVVLYAVTGGAVLLVDQDPKAKRPRIVARYAMVPGPASEFRGTTFLAGTGSALVADTDRDGEPELYAPLLPFRLLTLRSKPGVPLDAPLALGGWPLRKGKGRGASVPMISNYPRRMEDLMIFASPQAADLDGDGTLEVLMGSGGYLLHAFKRGGGEAEGFPKFTGGWIFSAPAVGDLDGDGRPEVVAVTREGYLFAWEASEPLAHRPRGADAPSVGALSGASPPSR